MATNRLVGEQYDAILAALGGGASTSDVNIVGQDLVLAVADAVNAGLLEQMDANLILQLNELISQGLTLQGIEDELKTGTLDTNIVGQDITVEVTDIQALAELLDQGITLDSILAKLNGTVDVNVIKDTYSPYQSTGTTTAANEIIATGIELVDWAFVSKQDCNIEVINENSATVQLQITKKTTYQFSSKITQVKIIETAIEYDLIGEVKI